MEVQSLVESAARRLPLRPNMAAALAGDGDDSAPAGRRGRAEACGAVAGLARV